MDVFVSNRLLARYGNKGLPDSIIDKLVDEARQETDSDVEPSLRWNKKTTKDVMDGYMLTISFDDKAVVDTQPSLKCDFCGRKLQISNRRPSRCVCCDVHDENCKHRQG